MSRPKENILDKTSLKILEILQQHGRISFRELAKQVNLSPSSLTERIRRMEEAGIIQGYGARINFEKIGYPVHAFVRMKRRSNEVGIPRKIKAMEGVRNFWIVAGDHDFLLEITAQSKDHLEHIIDHLFQYGVTTTSVVLSKITEDSLE